jgi:hypothetical protein
VYFKVFLGQLDVYVGVRIELGRVGLDWIDFKVRVLEKTENS